MTLTLVRPFLFLSLLPAPFFGDGPFRELSFEEALETAAQEERVIFIDFYTTWCAPCKQLDKVTWKDDAVIEWLNENTIAIKVDAEDEPDLARRFGVDVYPTLLFLSSNADERGRLIGYKEPSEFLTEAPLAMRGDAESLRVERQLERDPNNPGLRMRLGSALVRETRFEEALAQFLWCYDSGVKHDRTFTGVRTSFLLDNIVRLGKKYPAAVEALRDRELHARTVLLSEKGTYAEAVEVAAICRVLGENARVLETWDALVERKRLDSTIEAVLLDQVIDLMLDAERYTDVLSAVHDVDSYLERKLQFFAMATTGEEDESLVEYMLRSTLVDSAKVYAALLGAKDERASAFSTAVLEFNDSGLAYAQLVRAAARVSAWEPARRLLTLGYEILGEDGQAVLRSAERKLPKKERLPGAVK